MKGKTGFASLKIFSFFLPFIIVTFPACDSWMKSDGFFEDIEQQVKVANAREVSVYIRQSSIKLGTTSPAGESVQKIDIPFPIAATMTNEYGFYRWAAFSSEDFDKNGSDYKILFTDPAAPIAEYAELPPSVVSFAKPTAAVTTATVKADRNDIVIVPVCTERSAVQISIPVNGQRNVVRNAALRVNFSKPMNANTFKENITVTQSTSKVTAEGLDFDVKDVTNLFYRPVLSANKRLVTLQFKADAAGTLNSFAANAHIAVKFASRIEDLYGYKLSDNVLLEFDCGASFDTLSPIIKAMTAGTDDCRRFTSVETGESQNAAHDIRDGSFPSALLTRRIKKQLHLYVYAEDIADSSTTYIEGDVVLLGVKAAALTDKEAQPLEKRELPITSQSYTAGRNSSSLKGNFSDLVNGIVGASTTGGCLFDYNIGALPDGIIKIDVWAVDAVGNSGLDADYEAHSNGYKSIFVVKDTTPPAVTPDQIESKSPAARYGCYNAQTLPSLQFGPKEDGGITDAGEERLRSKSVRWLFRLTDSAGWTAEPDDERWQPADRVYSMPGTSAPAADGAVAVSVIFMDDLHNISKPIKLNSVLYDNTAPRLGKLSWTDSSGKEAPGLCSSSVLKDVQLNIPFTEAMSGIKMLRVTVTGNVDAGHRPFTADNFEIKYAAAGSKNFSVIPPSEYVISGNEIEFNAAYRSGTFALSALTVGDAEGRYRLQASVLDAAVNNSESGDIYISNDSTQPVVNAVNVPLLKAKDDARSVCGAVKRTLDSADINPFGLDAEQTGESYWLSDACFGGAFGKTPERIPLILSVTEKYSGIKTIAFTGDIRCTGRTALRIERTKEAQKSLVKGTDFTVSHDGRTLTFTNAKRPELVSDAPIVLYFDNMTVEHCGDGAKNSVNVQLTDFASNASEEAAGRDIFAANAAAVSRLEVADRGGGAKSTGAYIDGTDAAANRAAAAGYTNEDTVNAIIMFAEQPAGAGTKTLSFTGLKATAATKLYLEGESAPVAGTRLAEDALTLAASFIGKRTFVLTNLRLGNKDEAEAAEGIYAVSLKTESETGREAAGGSAKIRYDRTAPYWDAPLCALTAAPLPSGLRSRIYPLDEEGGLDMTNGKAVNKDGEIIRYYYSATTEKPAHYDKAAYTAASCGIVLKIACRDDVMLDGGGEDAFGCYSVYRSPSGQDAQHIDGAFVIRHGKRNDKDANGKYTQHGSDAWEYFGAVRDSLFSVAFRDRAGNVSPARSFHVVADMHMENTVKNGAAALPLSKTLRYYEPVAGYRINTFPSAPDVYTNVFSYRPNSSADKRMRIEYHLNELFEGRRYTFAEAAPTAEQSGLAYYAISGSESPVPTRVADDAPTAWNQWIPYEKGAGCITVYPNARTTGDGQRCFLHLKDNCGNTVSLPIRTFEHERAGIYEKFAADAEAPSIHGAFRYVDDTDAHEKDGTLKIDQSGTRPVNRYTSAAQFSATLSDGHSFTRNAANQHGTENAYALRTLMLAHNAYSEDILSEIDILRYSAGAWSYWTAAQAGEHIAIRHSYPVGITEKYLYLIVEDATGNRRAVQLTNSPDFTPKDTVWTHRHSLP